MHKNKERFCPWCGGKMVRGRRLVDEIKSKCTEDDVYVLWCNSCGAFQVNGKSNASPGYHSFIDRFVECCKKDRIME